MIKRNVLIFTALLGISVVAAVFLMNRPAGPIQAQGLVHEATAQAILDHVKSLKSPVVLLNLWASWCEPCKEEFPNLLSLKQKLAAQGVQIVFVSIDETRDLPAAEEFLRQQHVDFPTFYKGSQSLQFVTDLYPKWEGAVPTSLIFGPDMKILDAWEGDSTLAEFEERILRQLRGT